MPKIKLRVWDKENKRMLVPGEDDCISLEVDENGINVYDMEHPSAEKGFDLAHLDCDLLMSTGLKDKNGVEIYEGDILKNQWNERFVIEWYSPRFILKEKYNGGFDYFEIETESILEIIGNIYQNPELLEDE